MTKRGEYTQRLIQDTLYRMLVHNPNEKVTITKLCEAADINRATFYQHYSCIEDLYEKIATDFYMSIMEESQRILRESGPSAESIRKIVTINLQRYASVPAYYPLLTRTNQDKMHRFIYSQYVSKEMDTPYFRMLMDFVMSGGDGVCSKWIAKGCVTPLEEIADAISTFIFKCFS